MSVPASPSRRRMLAAVPAIAAPPGISAPSAVHPPHLHNPAFDAAMNRWQHANHALYHYASPITDDQLDELIDNEMAAALTLVTTPCFGVTAARDLLRIALKRLQEDHGHHYILDPTDRIGLDIRIDFAFLIGALRALDPVAAREFEVSGP